MWKSRDLCLFTFLHLLLLCTRWLYYSDYSIISYSFPLYKHKEVTLSSNLLIKCVCLSLNATIISKTACESHLNLWLVLRRESWPNRLCYCNHKVLNHIRSQLKGRHCILTALFPTWSAKRGSFDHKTTRRHSSSHYTTIMQFIELLILLNVITYCFLTLARHFL